mmetsp:Transcript_75398/g.194382  ORF Transcript_75398/g.194382 Transcript_75398/m.194382 type:complete len:247 (-) Transcript_75398:332-1072(-)
MALWLTKRTLPSATANSHAGHRAFAAIWRWRMPTPVFLRNSSRPQVSTQVHSPTRSAAGAFAGDGSASGATSGSAAAAGAGSAAAAASPFASASAIGWRSLSTGSSTSPSSRSTTAWASSASCGGGLMLSAPTSSLAAAFPSSSALAPSREGRDAPLLAVCRRRCSGRSVTRSVPVGWPRFSSVSSRASCATISLGSSTVTEPQCTSLWKRFLFHTWTVSFLDAPGPSAGATLQDASHCGCRCAHL